MQKRTQIALSIFASIALTACGQQDEDASSAAVETQDESTATEAPASTEAASTALEVEPNGTVIEIGMYTRDPDDPGRMQVFKPNLVTADVGDTVRFVPVDPTHQSSSIAEMIPEGVTGWKGEINNEVSYVVPKPGVYGYKCIPHYAAGMVGLIIVKGEGKLANLEAAQSVTHQGLAAREFSKVFEAAEAEGMLTE